MEFIKLLSAPNDPACALDKWKLCQRLTVR